MQHKDTRCSGYSTSSEWIHLEGLSQLADDCMGVYQLHGGPRIAWGLFPKRASRLLYEGVFEIARLHGLAGGLLVFCKEYCQSTLERTRVQSSRSSRGSTPRPFASFRSVEIRGAVSSWSRSMRTMLVMPTPDFSASSPCVSIARRRASLTFSPVVATVSILAVLSFVRLQIFYHTITVFCRRMVIKW